MQGIYLKKDNLFRANISDLAILPERVCSTKVSPETLTIKLVSSFVSCKAFLSFSYKTTIYYLCLFCESAFFPPFQFLKSVIKKTWKNEKREAWCNR